MLKSIFKKTLILFTGILLFSISLSAQSKVYQPRVSAAAELKQKIGVTDVIINYSRPQVIFNENDRTGNVYGGLAYYGYRKINFAAKGEVPWRAGANENTTISFSTEVKVEGKTVKAGTYALFIALSEDGNETLILSKKHDGWGSFFYDPKDNVLSTQIQSRPIAFTNILTYDFEEIGTNHGVLALKWEKKKFPFKIEVNTTEIVLDNFRKVIHETKDVKEMSAGANYSFQANTNHKEALSWISEAISADKSFRNLTVKAGLLMQTHHTEDAIKIADEAAHIANANELNNLGYQMIQIGQLDKAIDYFQLNIDRNPEDANGYDSLGEAYAAKGENKKAIKSFKKSLSMNPAPNVKQNSIAQLKKLGVDYQE